MVLHHHGMLDHHHRYQIHQLKETAEIEVIQEIMIVLVIVRHIVMKDRQEEDRDHRQVVAIDHVILEDEVPQEKDLVPDRAIEVGKITVVEVVVRIVVVIAIVIDPDVQDLATVEVVLFAIENQEVEIEQDQDAMMISQAVKNSVFHQNNLIKLVLPQELFGLAT